LSNCGLALQVYPRGELCVAEWWYDGGVGDPAFTTAEMLAEYADAAEGHFGCFDFPLKTAIHNAALTEDWSLLGSKDGLPGLVGIRPHLAFTFIDNHDTSAPQVCMNSSGRNNHSPIICKTCQ
jgi:hypothetical protein